MTRNVLGSEGFFSGLQTYLKKYSYGNANTDDLWECLTQVRQPRDDNSLRYIAMIAKFLADNKPKTSLKSEFALFQT